MDFDRSTADRDPFDSLQTTYVGIYIVFAFISAVFFIILLAVLVRFVKQYKRMSPICSGSLRYCAASGNIEGLELLKRQPNFDVNASHEGFTALSAACVAGHYDAVKWLMENGADPTITKTDDWEDTPLHYASAKGYFDICNLLKQYGAKETENFAGYTPEDMAPKLPSKPSLPASTKADSWVLERRRDNYGTEGTTPYPLTNLTRFFVVFMILVTFVYLFWRSTRSINTAAVIYSGFIFFCELTLTLQFLLSLCLMWCPITRPEMKIDNLGIAPEDYPSIDIIVVTYNEKVDIIEATVCAAARMNWPQGKLTIHVCVNL